MYLYKTTNKSVSFDECHWYINDEQQQQKEEDDISKFRIYAEAEAFNVLANDIIKYTSNFKNIAVLAGSGTSMENGEHKGMTRNELWESCKDEINAISSRMNLSGGNLKDKCHQILDSKNIENFLSFTILYPLAELI